MKTLNESVNSSVVKKFITDNKDFIKYFQVIYYWLNNKGETVWTKNLLPQGKSALTGLDKLTDDDIVAYTDYTGDCDPYKIDLRSKDGGHPMIKKVFSALGNKIKDARFLVNIYVITRKGTENHIFVLNNNGLQKYQEAIKAKKQDVEQGHSDTGSNPYKMTSAEKYKSDKAESKDVKEWLHPLKDKVQHVYICRVGMKDGKQDTLISMDVIKDNKFEGLQYLTDKDIIEKDSGKGYFKFDNVNLLGDGGEEHIKSLFKKMSRYQLNDAKILVVVETNDNQVVSFALNEEGLKRYARAVERYKKDKK